MRCLSAISEQTCSITFTRAMLTAPETGNLHNFFSHTNGWEEQSGNQIGVVQISLCKDCEL